MSVTRTPVTPRFPAAEPDAGQPPSRAPMMLSAFVAPGAGQFAQRRWLAGFVYGFGFLALFVAFIVSVFRILWVYYGLPYIEGAQPPPRVPAAQAVGLFLACMALYLAALLDTWVAYRRACSRWTEARIAQALRRETGPR
jgi:hypothetical protein